MEMIREPISKEDLAVMSGYGILLKEIPAYFWECWEPKCNKSFYLLSLPQMLNAIKKHQERHRKK